jgi:hypothetical protein
MSCGLLNPVLVKNFTLVTSQASTTSHNTNNKYSKSTVLAPQNRKKPLPNTNQSGL